MITNFNKSNLKSLRMQLDNVLNDFAEQEGLEISLGNITFMNNEFSAKIKAKIKGTVGKSDAMLQHYMTTLNLVQSKNSRKLVEYRSRNTIYPFIFEENGITYRCSTEQAKHYFGK